jgi:hypothetical protein
MQLGCSFACSWKSPEISVYLSKHRRGVFIDFSWFVPNFALHINNIDWEIFWLFICFEDLYISLKNISPLLDEWLSNTAIFWVDTWPAQPRASSSLPSSSHWSPGNEVDSYINTRGNWENSKLCENTPPFGRRVSTQFLVLRVVNKHNHSCWYNCISTRKMFYIC